MISKAVFSIIDIKITVWFRLKFNCHNRVVTLSPLGVLKMQEKGGGRGWLGRWFIFDALLGLGV